MKLCKACPSCASSALAIAASIARSPCPRPARNRSPLLERRGFLAHRGDAPVRGHLAVTGLRVQLADQHGEEARLAAAVGTDETDTPSRVQLQVGVLDERAGAAGERQLPEPDSFQSLAEGRARVLAAERVRRLPCAGQRNPGTIRDLPQATRLRSPRLQPMPTTRHTLSTLPSACCARFPTRRCTVPFVTYRHHPGGLDARRVQRFRSQWRHRRRCGRGTVRHDLLGVVSHGGLIFRSFRRRVARDDLCPVSTSEAYAPLASLLRRQRRAAYGTTSLGAVSRHREHDGTVFRINTDGTRLHDPASAARRGSESNVNGSPKNATGIPRDCADRGRDGFLLASRARRPCITGAVFILARWNVIRHQGASFVQHRDLGRRNTAYHQAPRRSLAARSAAAGTDGFFTAPTSRAA